MKHIMSRVLAFFIILAATSVFSAQAHAETIRLFDARYDILENNTMRVTETIEYDFGTDSRHGIYRDIPLTFRPPGNLLPIGIRDISVTDASGTPLAFKTSGFSTKQIKIGDADKYVTGLNTYVISYVIQGPVGFLDTFDELYWSVTGNSWGNVPIQRTKVALSLPGNSSMIDTYAYCGSYGDTSQCGAFETTQNEIIFESDRALNPSEGITLSVSFDKGLVSKTTVLGLLARLAPYLATFPVFVFLVWLIVRKRLRRLGTYLKFKRTHPDLVQYDSAGITPLEASYLDEGVLQAKDVSAYIVWAAIEGYISISENKGVYGFKKEKEFDTLSYRESAFLDALSKTRLEKGSFGQSRVRPLDPQYKKGHLMSFLYKSSEETVHEILLANALTQVLNETVENMLNKEYIDPKLVNGNLRQPSVTLEPISPYDGIGKDKIQLYSAAQSFRTHLSGVSIGLGMIIIAAVGLFIMLPEGLMLGVFASLVLLAAGITNLFIKTVPPYTESGFEKAWYMRGLKKYIDMAEQDRIRVHNAPEKTPVLFEKLLPCAMVFGLEKKWLKEFEGIVSSLEWYHSDAPLDLVSLSSLSSVASSSFASSTSSSSGSGGGGFSGGGGGGGGGGSW